MGGELGTRVAQLIEARVGDRDRRRRLRAAAPAAAPRRVPAHRSARHRSAVGLRRGIRTAGGRALRGVRPASRMTPESAKERTDACTAATLNAAAGTGALEYVVLRSGLEVYGPPTASVSVPDEKALPATDHAVRPVVALCRSCGQRCGVAVWHSGRRAAVRAGPGLTRSEPARPAAPAPGRPGQRGLRSAVLGTASRRRGARDGCRDRAPARRALQRRR